MGNIVEKTSYSIDEFCRLNGVGRTFVYEQIKLGRLMARKAGARTLIVAEDALAWVHALPAIKPGTKRR